ncbi:hypothetical protein AB0N09_05650 [Streptomyces erythrochromogenes]|uniref:hypothetical protein n=1 Tax=Streptomyces erythrochromogenes TaxID=285574 RepID=UPI00342B4E68
MPIQTGATERAGMQGLLDGGSAGEIAGRLHTSVASLGEALARTRSRHDMPLRIVALLALNMGELRVPAPPRVVRALTSEQEAAVKTWATTPSSDLGDIGRRARVPASELKSLLRHAQQHLGFGPASGWEAELRLLGTAVALRLVDPAEAAQSLQSGSATQ